ncbi:MAG: UDP-N-acetylmuramate dehydrogenase [Clostridiales bacterium]|nr:UDP-N-acetylmuramate dehydrogenase [Clostridiales bacterium]
MNDFGVRLAQIAKVEENAPMASYTSFRAGGAARYLVFPDTEESLLAVMEAVREEGIPYYVTGNGSNILVKDGGFPGVIIKIADGFSDIETDGTKIRAGAGALLSAISREVARQSLTGLEFASGIPGSLGGAVYMNAGAYDGEMKQILQTVRLLDPVSGAVRDADAAELELAYRYSRLYETGEIVLGAVMQLAEGDPAAIAEKMRDLNRRRTTKQPLAYPSAGSFFKRPEGYFAGKLVQDAGLKGLTVGGAQVSTLHSGFVINIGGATATDIITLMHLVQARVKEQFGVDLHPEVRIIGVDQGESDSLA